MRPVHFKSQMDPWQSGNQGPGGINKVIELNRSTPFVTPTALPTYAEATWLAAA
jgi:hypothetical protein